MWNFELYNIQTVIALWLAVKLNHERMKSYVYSLITSLIDYMQICCACQMQGTRYTLVEGSIAYGYSISCRPTIRLTFNKLPLCWILTKHCNLLYYVNLNNSSTTAHLPLCNIIVQNESNTTYAYVCVIMLLVMYHIAAKFSLTKVT